MAVYCYEDDPIPQCLCSDCGDDLQLQTLASPLGIEMGLVLERRQRRLPDPAVMEFWETARG